MGQRVLLVTWIWAGAPLRIEVLRIEREKTGVWYRLAVVHGTLEAQKEPWRVLRVFLGDKCDDQVEAAA